MEAFMTMASILITGVCGTVLLMVCAKAMHDQALNTAFTYQNGKTQTLALKKSLQPH